MTVIVVLADQETFSGLDGAFLVEVPDKWETQDIERALKREDVTCTDVWLSEDESRGIDFGTFSAEAIERIEAE